MIEKKIEIVKGKSNLWLGIIQQLQSTKKDWYFLILKHKDQQDEFIVNNGDLYTRIEDEEEIKEKFCKYYSLDEEVQFEIYRLEGEIEELKSLKKFDLMGILLSI